MVSKMIKGADVLLNTKYQDFIKEHPSIADKIVYTGPIDEYFNYSLGKLEYRTVIFENELLDKPDYQGNAVINYTERDIPCTRIIEHKYFDLNDKQTKTYCVISNEDDVKSNKFTTEIEIMIGSKDIKWDVISIKHSYY